MKKRTSRVNTIFLFTLLWFLLSGAIFLFFRAQGRSLVYQGDGWRQHLRALACYGKYLRGALRHLLVEHSLTPQTWGVDFGYGADVITTLQYYCLGDPLAALALFVPTARTLALYEALLLLRPYLAGLSFCAYAFLRGEKRTAPILTGALIYSFSGTVLYIGMLHPYFVNPMIYFPLMLSGVERALSQRRPEEGSPAARRFVPFAAAVALAALSNFYFFYMLAVFTAAYGAARLLQLHGSAGKRGRALFSSVLRDGAALLGAACVGLLCAGVTLLPVLAQFQGNPRAGISFAHTLFYERAYYAQLPRNLASWINHPLYDTELCFALTFIPLAVFLLLRKGHRTLKLCLALTILLLLFPAGGIFLNGFSYMINRWTWAAAMLAGWICVRAASELSALPADRGDKRADILSFCASALIPSLTAALILWNIVCAFAPSRGAFPGEFMERMDADAYLAASADNEVSAAAAASEADADAFFRYSGRNLTWNAALASGLSSTQFEFSFANGAVSEFFQLLGVNDEQNFAYFALDDRMPLLSLAGVRYYTLAYDNYYEYRFIPYGFGDQGMIGRYHLYKNPYALPLGFAADRVMARSELEQLPLALREETLLRAAVVEDSAGRLPARLSSALSPERQYTAKDAADDAIGYEIPFDLFCGEGVAFAENTFTVTEAGAVAALRLPEPVPADCELLLSLENLWVDSDTAHYEPTFTSRVGGEEWIAKQIRYKTPATPYYSDWHNFLIDFGCRGEAVDEITIEFPAAGSVAFDRMALSLRPMEQFPSFLQTRGENHLQNPDLHENPISRATGEITGDITLADDALLVFTLPYSRGFSAFVDGEKTPVYKTDAMFLSVPAAAGTHHIRIIYRTPGLRAGFFCSLLGIALLLLMRFRHISTGISVRPGRPPRARS